MDKISSPSTPAPADSGLSGIGPDCPSHRQVLAQSVPHLSELTLGLLHKFNSLFTGVMFLTEGCIDSEKDKEPVEERLREVLATLREAHTYVNRITQLHINEEEEASYHDLGSVIAGQLDLARLLLPRGTALTVATTEEQLTFYATQRAFRDILLHVIGNSGEALPKRGGAVSITSRVDATQAGSVVVEFRDNGPGIPAEILRRLFVSACTTKDENKHAGLGLLHCRELARSLGGDLAAGNHSGGGAIVTLTLPRDQSQPSP